MTTAPAGQTDGIDHAARTDRREYHVMRAVLALVLLAAAALKTHQLATQPTLGEGLLSSRAFLTVEVEFEILLGLWLLSGLYRRLAWAVTAGCFAVFAGVAFYKGVRGEASCGCFGVVAISPWVTLIFDVLCLGGLLALRPDLRRAKPMNSFRLRLGGFGGAAVVAGIAAAMAAASFQASRLSPKGEFIGNGRFVLLETKSWVGKPLPLLQHITMREDLAKGKWRVILYRHDCPNCRDDVANLIKPPPVKGGPARSAFVEMAPYAEGTKADILPAGGAFSRGRLSDGKDWIIETPVVLELDRGVVVSCQEGPAVKAHAAELAAKMQFPKSAPVVQVPSSEASYDFGFVTPDSAHYVQFLVANPSGKVIPLRKVHSECACMAVMDPPTSIAMGQATPVRVCLVAPKETTNYSKRILLVPDGKGTVVALRISARVGLPLEAKPPVIDLGTMIEGEQRLVPLTLVNHGDKVVRPVYGTSTVSGCTPKIPQAQVPARGELAIPISIRAASGPGGKTQGTVQVQTDCAGQAAVGAGIRYAVSPLYRMACGGQDLGALRPGEKRTVLLELTATKDAGRFVKGCKVADAQGLTAAEPAMTFAGRSCLVQCPLVAGSSDGPVSGRILLDLVDHAQQVQIDITGRVKTDLAAKTDAAKPGKEAL
jgi:hypothetical protein